MGKVDIAVIVGSDSDLEIINETIKVLKEFNVPHSLNIASAHRTVEHLKSCVEIAQANGVKVFIAGAGMAAALPGVVAAETCLPVIGVPMKGSSLSSFDSLFSIVQMPKGVPVATVAVGKTGAANAAVLAIQIIAVSDEELNKKLKEYRKNMAKQAIEKDMHLQALGIEKYMQEKL
ncbi:MAG: 5-(carboxyamino)imidazole ribonucleotide mutase [Elusimicrobiota bacterium]|jgi:5-(carboxyamino)imidazole ribonucleotide mutase|nr:5-(carboxyamino)imidazole ribonucleotide mutase [Elusimicrobiota bacterium]